jgi:hypothetical protein
MESHTIEESHTAVESVVVGSVVLDDLDPQAVTIAAAAITNKICFIVLGFNGLTIFSLLYINIRTRFQISNLFFYFFVRPVGIEPTCDQLRFLLVMSESRYERMYMYYFLLHLFQPSLKHKVLK